MGNKTEDSPGVGSEHKIDGDRFDLEMHLVNVNLDEPTQKLFKAAVIGFLFTVDDSKNETSFADDFFVNLMDPNITDKMSFKDSFLDFVNFD